MNIALTGATGFLGRYIADRLANSGHRLRCWYRVESDITGFGDADKQIDWVTGSLDAPRGFGDFCCKVDAVVHSALFRPAGFGFRAAGQQAFEEFIRVNLLGTLSLMKAARDYGVPRFVFISTCAVHEVILPDRVLDETHPTWAMSHYGAHKAAAEQFVSSFGRGDGWDICALRPTGIYGLAHPPAKSRWHDIVKRVGHGEPFSSNSGGKEVHAADVARAVELLLSADAERIRGEAFNCYDMYVAERHVAAIAREMSGSTAVIEGENKGPKNQIDTTKLRALGMTFGGEPLLRQTIEQLLKS